MNEQRTVLERTLSADPVSENQDLGPLFPTSKYEATKQEAQQMIELLMMKSDVDSPVIVKLAGFMQIAEMMKSQSMLDYAVKILRLLVSKMRLGRREDGDVRMALANRNEFDDTMAP